MSDSRWIHRLFLTSAMLAVIPVAGSGTTTVLADFPDGKTINRFEGTYSD